jgi:hypothetical protein
MATRKKKPTGFTKAEVLAMVKASAQVNAKAGTKAFYTDNGASLLADAIAHAFTIPTLASAGIGNGRGRAEAEARRKFCQTVKAKAVTPDKVLRKNTSGRAENAIDQRLQAVAVLMGLDAKAFYAVRSKPVTADESPKVFVIADTSGSPSGNAGAFCVPRFRGSRPVLCPGRARIIAV